MNEKSLTVYQANPLVESVKYKNLEENRLFLACLQGVVPHLPNSLYYDEEFKEVTIPTEKIIELFGGNNKYYDTLKDVAERLLGKYIFIEDKERKSFEGYTVFSRIKFDPKIGGLKYKFNDDMKPWLLELHEIGYTKIDLGEVFCLSSNYALRILELLIQYRGLAINSIIKRNFTIERMRLILQVPKMAYVTCSLFLTNVIKKPIEEINTKTQYKIFYKPIRTGRKTTSIDFAMILPEAEEQDKSKFNEMIESHHLLRSRLEKLGVNKKVISTWMCQEPSELLDMISQLAIRKDMTAAKLVGGMKPYGWVRMEFENLMNKKIMAESRERDLRELRSIAPKRN